MTTIIRGKAEGEGSITVQGRLLAETVALLPKERVDLELNNLDLTLRSGKQRSTLRGVAADDFPVIPEVTANDEIAVEAPELARALAQVVFAINPDEGRPEISGVYVGCTTAGVVLAGTDSYRLAERRLVASGQVKREVHLIVPLKTAQEVARIAAQTEGEVGMVVGDNQILWRLGETKVVSRLIAGQYPDYQQIIPKNLTTKVTLERLALVQAARAAGLFVRSGINDVRLLVNPDAKSLQVSAANSQLGEYTTELGLSGAHGEPTEIVFNYRYMLDGLQAITTSEVTLELSDAKTPGVLRPAGEPGKHYLYIIMPIRQ